MPAWGDFARQRLGRQRGSLENLRTYGLTGIAFPCIVKQCAMYLGIVAVSLMLFTSGLFVCHGLYTAALRGCAVAGRARTIAGCLRADGGLLAPAGP